MWDNYCPSNSISNSSESVGAKTVQTFIKINIRVHCFLRDGHMTSSDEVGVVIKNQKQLFWRYSERTDGQ